jgi:hypothetical protein
VCPVLGGRVDVFLKVDSGACACCGGLNYVLVDLIAVQ